MQKFCRSLQFIFLLAVVGCHSPGEYSQKPVHLRLMTYNIRIGEGGGEWNNDPAKINLEPAANLIAAHAPDFVGLQEVDQNKARTGYMDQPRWLSCRLGMQAAFQPAYIVNGSKGPEHYGIGLLSRHALGESERFPLFKPDYSKSHPHYPDYYSEQRALLHAAASVEGRLIHIFVTHLGLTADQREKQIAQIAEITSRYSGPKILLGDFNAEPGETAFAALDQSFQDALSVARVGGEERKSFPVGRSSKEAIDYIFVSPEFRVLKAEVVRDDTGASDHNPVVAEVELLPAFSRR